MAAAYYNEIDPYAAAWLRNLIASGHIPAGDVDERSIVDVRPDDLRGYTQCHFFAGIGGWAYAARLAGWPDDEPLWTGSCPCQPFSVAGKGWGVADERHLWPEFHRLIAGCRPAVVAGEQVAAAVGKGWLDGVLADLEGSGYTYGSAVLPACSVDAPHRRDRLWFVAESDSAGRQPRLRDGAAARHRHSVAAAGDAGIVADAGSRRLGRAYEGQVQQPRRAETVSAGIVADASRDGIRLESGRLGGARGTGARIDRNDQQGDVAHAQAFGSPPRPYEPGADIGADESQRLRARSSGALALTEHGGREGRHPQGRGTDAALPSGEGFWRDAGWLTCADGKARRVVADLRSVVDGLSQSLAGLRAEFFVEATAEVEGYASATQSRPEEIVQAVRQAAASQAVWQEPRGFFGIREAEVLLPFLRELERRYFSAGAPGASAQVSREGVRSLRVHALSARTPQGRRPHEQHPGQHPDALHALSQFLALAARQAFEALCGNAPIVPLLARGVEARVAKLRAFGNAIIPQVAAEFLAAYREARLFI